METLFSGQILVGWLHFVYLIFLPCCKMKARSVSYPLMVLNGLGSGLLRTCGFPHHCFTWGNCVKIVIRITRDYQSPREGWVIMLCCNMKDQCFNFLLLSFPCPHHNIPIMYPPLLVIIQCPHLQSEGNTNLPSAFQVFCENQ